MDPTIPMQSAFQSSAQAHTQVAGPLQNLLSLSWFHMMHLDWESPHFLAGHLAQVWSAREVYPQLQWLDQGRKVTKRGTVCLEPKEDTCACSLMESELVAMVLHLTSQE